MREKVWWPDMSIDLETLIKHCHTCQVSSTIHVKCQLLQMSEFPKRSWEILAMDLKGSFALDKHLLVIIDKMKIPTISFIIFLDFSIFYQIFLPPQVKRWVIITYKHGIYELPNNLEN